ncbi:hypothetical protein ACU4GR_14855 [Methylobacterium oryzae CBMB20]
MHVPSVRRTDEEAVMRVAIVHDWLCIVGGAERVLEQLLRIYPDADVFALFDFLPEADRARLGYHPGAYEFHPAPAVRADAAPQLPAPDAARD